MRENQWAIFHDAFTKITAEAKDPDYVFKDLERERLTVLAEDIFGIQLSIMEVLNARTLSDLERQIQYALTKPQEPSL